MKTSSYGHASEMEHNGTSNQLTDSDTDSTTDDQSTELIEKSTDGYHHIHQATCCSCLQSASFCQHIMFVQKQQLGSVLDCSRRINCRNSYARLDSENTHRPWYSRERMKFLFKAICNRSVLSSVTVFLVVGMCGCMIFEV